MADNSAPPTSEPSLLGSATLPDLLRMLGRCHWAVDRPYRRMLFRALLNSSISTVFSCSQEFIYGADVRRVSLREPPLFVLGHWRSGTTYLHDLLARDPRHTYPTTFECFLPNHFLLTEDFVARRAPKEHRHRPMDNVASGWDTPQEDEFALLLLGQPSPYLRIAFPSLPALDAEYLDLEGVPPVRRTDWKRTLHRFLQKITWKRPGQLVLKSPTHTARIKVLLELYPDARFVYIVRNPFQVIPSTLKTFRVLSERQALQTSMNAGLEERVFADYQRMFRRLEEGRRLVAPERFVEVRYEKLVADPVAGVQAIYKHLQLDGFDRMRPALESYLASLGSYQKNEHVLPAPLRDAIAKNCGAVLEQYGYRGDSA